MPRDPDIALYRAFIAVAEERGMTAAARKLHLTQAAVSQQIRRLEEALSCQLFLRGHRSIPLTPAGERLLPKARAIVKLSDELWADMTAPPVFGKVRLGAPADVLGTFLPDALSRFSREHPQVDITLVCHASSRLIEDWENGSVDVALIEEQSGSGAEADFKESLLVDRLVWIGAKNGDAVNRTPLPVSLSNDTNALRPAMVNALTESAVNYRTVSELGTMETVCATVRTDLAVTAMLLSTVPGDVEVLSGHRNLPDLPHFEVAMLASKDPENDVAKALENRIHAAFSKAKRTFPARA